MRWRTRLFLTLAIFQSAVGAAFAAPSFYGPTGLIVMPTARAVGARQYSVFATRADNESPILGAPGYRDEIPGPLQCVNMGLNYGMGGRLELGATAVSLAPRVSLGDPSPGNSRTEVIFNAKLVLLAETAEHLALAVGALNLASNRDFGALDPYVVLSKTLGAKSSPRALTGHLGYIGGDIRRIMLGSSYGLTPRITLLADWVRDNPGLSCGARYTAGGNLFMDVASIGGQFGVSASYSFAVK